MSYANAVESLYSLGHELATQPGTPRRKWELAHMRTLCHALGDPQSQFKSVLIAGTNGKGSTSATLASILNQAGLRTALYTSPHLVRVNERIQLSMANATAPVSLQPISDDDFARCYFRVDDTARRLVDDGQLPHPPSFFEVMTALAFLHFAESHAGIAILEVGLGGRLDATNIVEPLLSILTDISLDHTEWLGNTITEIAREKAGILRPNGILVTLPQHPEANQAIGEAAVALNVRGINAADYIPSRTSERGHPEPDETTLSPATFRNRYVLNLLGEELPIDSPLYGQHQQRNIALAIAAAIEICNTTSYNITGALISQGIHNTVWPGRLELIPCQDKYVLLDVAHNPAGAWALRSILSHLPDELPRTLLFACLGDKPVDEITQILVPLFERPGNHIVLTQVDNPRAAPVGKLLASVTALCCEAVAEPDPAVALAQALALTQAGGLVMATGSVYLVGKIRSLILADEYTQR